MSMHLSQPNPTDELIRESARLTEALQRAIQDLGNASQEISETVAFLKWWRFLDYDVNTLHFLENLDTPVFDREPSANQ